MSLATAAYEEESWLDAAEYSDLVLEALADLTERLPLPRYYAVRLIPERRDCLWRIAEYPFVYGDPWKWRLLYDANKAALVNPNDPDLVLPGQILEIPSLRGEFRSGTWDPSKPYVELPKP
jgi:nucleoid-associated protein YgaU